MEKATDWLGQEYRAGDVISYIDGYGSHSYTMALYKVIEFEDTMKGGRPMSKTYAPDGYHVMAKCLHKISRIWIWNHRCNEDHVWRLKLPSNITKVEWPPTCCGEELR